MESITTTNTLHTIFKAKLLIITLNLIVLIYYPIVLILLKSGMIMSKITRQ
jgi:hypothetical protein